MEVQKIKVTNEIYLNDIDLEKNKQMDIYTRDKENELILLRVANVEGKIVIFSSENISIEKWEGARPFEERINEIYDNELD